MATIDRLDAEILGRVAATARPGVAEIAASLGVSRVTVQQRLKHLEETGILLGYQPIIDLDAVGLAVQALVTLEIDQRLMAPIVDGLAALPEVLEVRIQAGREDLLVRVAIESLEALQTLTAAIVGIEGVRKTTSTFTVSTPVPYRAQPALAKLTADAGWGRSTPSPDVH
ncbi:Lrp/AsnC family transcriptional regulator [Nocardioides sp. L-11A]|uniref:Lrp/AsnC family transcriptional regulator n=1 Tax=Nocardioides sp. L-11A TaxID=3043848 RepID=UPI00249C23DC|nr:Lrp/AsnC family transcriptional regulator [Nocardioides sp. L-11A]